MYWLEEHWYLGPKGRCPGLHQFRMLGNSPKRPYAPSEVYWSQGYSKYMSVFETHYFGCLSCCCWSFFCVGLCFMTKYRTPCSRAHFSFAKDDRGQQYFHDFLQNSGTIAVGTAWSLIPQKSYWSWSRGCDPRSYPSDPRSRPRFDPWPYGTSLSPPPPPPTLFQRKTKRKTSEGPLFMMSRRPSHVRFFILF